MKVLILGHARHGKDTAAEILSKDFGLTFISSSYAALSVIYPVISLVTGETDPEKLFTNRFHHRELWKRCISLYNTPDKSALVRKVLEQADIYVGMRCPVEFTATEDLFDWIIWIDRGRYQRADQTMGIEFDPARMVRIDNNGTVEELKEKLRTWMEVVVNG